MKLKHKISISVREADGGITNVLHGGEVQLREKLLRWLFGDKKKVLVIAPGESVFDVEIREQDLGKVFDEYLEEALLPTKDEQLEATDAADTTDTTDAADTTSTINTTDAGDTKDTTDAAGANDSNEEADEK